MEVVNNRILKNWNSWTPAFWKRSKSHKRLKKKKLLNCTKQDKMCEFSRKSLFQSYVQHKNKQFTYLLPVGCLWKEEGTISRFATVKILMCLNCRPHRAEDTHFQLYALWAEGVSSLPVQLIGHSPVPLGLWRYVYWVSFGRLRSFGNAAYGERYD